MKINIFLFVRKDILMQQVATNNKTELINLFYDRLMNTPYFSNIKTEELVPFHMVDDDFIKRYSVESYWNDNYYIGYGHVDITTFDYKNILVILRFDDNDEVIDKDEIEYIKYSIFRSDYMVRIDLRLCTDEKAIDSIISMMIPKLDAMNNKRILEIDDDDDDYGSGINFTYYNYPVSKYYKYNPEMYIICIGKNNYKSLLDNNIIRDYIRAAEYSYCIGIHFDRYSYGMIVYSKSYQMVERIEEDILMIQKLYSLLENKHYFQVYDGVMYCDLKEKYIVNRFNRTIFNLLLTISKNDDIEERVKLVSLIYYSKL